jgi:PAS domain S-box-containing protein
MPEKAVKETPEMREFRAQLEEAQETLNAIRRGEVDGLVVSTPKGEQVYSISGAETPYRVLMENMREGAITLSDDNTILYCNLGFAKMMKVPLEKIVGNNIENMISPTFKIAFKELLAKCRSGPKQEAEIKGITFIADDKTLVPTQISVNSLNMDHTTTTFIVVTDLTHHMEEDLKRYTADLEKAGAALFESEQRWSTTLGSIGDAVISTDMAGKITYMNDVAEELTGWPLAKASGKPVQAVFKIISMATRKIVDDPVAKVLKKGQVVGLANHTILIRQNGTEVPIDDSGAPIKDKAGKTTGVVLIFRDITERRKAEEALKQSQARIEQERDRLGSLLNSISDEVWFADAEKKFILANPSAVKEFKLDSKKAVDVENLVATLEVYGPDGTIRPVDEAPPLRALKGEVVKNQEETVRTPESGELRTRLVNSTPIRNQNGDIIGAVSVVRDITERKKAEEELDSVNKRLETILNSISDGFLVYDRNWRYTYVNQRAAEIVGVPREKMLGSCIWELFPYAVGTKFDTEYHRAVSTGKAVHFEEYYPDPVNVWFEVSAYPSEEGLSVFFQDITERKKAEVQLEDYKNNLEKIVEERTKQLKDSERLAAIGATAGMVGHDIRNPLQAIAGDVYLLREELRGMPEREEKNNAEESLLGIEKNVDYINKIVADLQDFARPLKPNAEETDIKLVIDELLKKNGLPENIKATVKVGADARKVVADFTFINRIMYNLVNNAVQAMPKGGKLYINAYKEAKDILITVKDTGVGIPEAVKGKLFTPMFTTKSKGQGFGLAVIKRMTEALGGTVTFESQEGKGTTFVVRLPPPKESKR